MKPDKGAFLILAAASLWGTAGLFVRSLSAAGVSEMSVVFVRALFSFLALALMVLAVDRRLFRIRLRDLWLFAATGIFSIVLFNFCYYRTMRLSSLSVAAVLLYTAPFFVVFLSALLFGERLTLKKCLACVSAFLGCVLVSGVLGTGTAISGACVIYGLLTGFGYALYTVFGNILLKKGYHSLTITLYTFVFAFLGSLPLADLKNVFAAVFSLKSISAAGETAAVPFGHLPVIAVAVGMALLNTVLPYILYTNGLKTVPPGSAPIIATVEPVVASLIGLLVFGEKMSAAQTAGILLVIGSVVILNLKTGRKAENGNEAKGLCQDQSDA